MPKRIIKQYCAKKIRKIRHRKGFGVHSPFAYNLITRVIEERCGYYAYQQVSEVWRAQVRNKLTAEEYSMCMPFSEKNGQLLFRLVNRFRPGSVFEYGSFWGISTLYLHLGNPHARIICAEPHSYVCNLSKNLFSTKPSVRFLNSGFSDGLSEYIDGIKSPGFICIHRLSSAEEYESVFEQLYPCINKSVILFVEGIRSGDKALQAWRKFIADERVRVTMDLFDSGIAVCDPKLNKQDYIVAF